MPLFVGLALSKDAHLKSKSPAQQNMADKDAGRNGRTQFKCCRCVALVTDTFRALANLTELSKSACRACCRLQLCSTFVCH